MMRSLVQRWRARWLAVLPGMAAGLLLVAGTPVHAEDADNQHFAVRTAYTELIGGVYYLDADVEYNLTDEALDALQNSVPLHIEMQIEIIHVRSWWFNETVASLTQGYELRYHPLSQLYIVRNLNSGQQQTFTNYRSAILKLGQVTDLPVIDASLLDPEGEYRIRMRSVLDVKDYPAPLRLFASLWSDWQLSS
ncbi:MAG: DUF4390 domain-containing protein, partial [Gammaproteobacteria bacterium]